MSKSRRNGDIYAMLPRFVTAPEPEQENPRFLQLVERTFERNGVQFRFEIVPACILIENVGTTNFYPGAAEEQMESALRWLAVEDNPNFMESENLVIFSLTEIISQLEMLDSKSLYSREQIDHSLKILCRTAYRLSLDDRYMYFHAIEQLSEREENGEKYYLVRFSSLFLHNTETFEFCFGIED